MTCHNCQSRSGVYDLTLICCSARFARKVATDQYDKTLAKLAHDHGHSLHDLKAEADRQRRQATHQG